MHVQFTQDDRIISIRDVATRAAAFEQVDNLFYVHGWGTARIVSDDNATVISAERREAFADSDLDQLPDRWDMCD